jgi:hypothetical protein
MEGVKGNLIPGAMLNFGARATSQQVVPSPVFIETERFSAWGRAPAHNAETMGFTPPVAFLFFQYDLHIGKYPGMIRPFFE